MGTYNIGVSPSKIDGNSTWEICAIGIYDLLPISNVIIGRITDTIKETIYDVFDDKFKLKREGKLNPL